LLVVGKGIKVDMETKIDKLLSEPLVVINVGLSKFAKSLEEQDVDVIQVDWVPPAGGDKEMMDLLEELL
jgi:FdrA protein